jgi:hypothetical protein
MSINYQRFSYEIKNRTHRFIIEDDETASHQQEHILPYLLPGSKRTIEEIMAVHESTIPLCWNYDINQYPLSYQVNGSVHERDNSGGFQADECDEAI